MQQLENQSEGQPVRQHYVAQTDSDIVELGRQGVGVGAPTRSGTSWAAQSASRHAARQQSRHARPSVRAAKKYFNQQASWQPHVGRHFSGKAYDALSPAWSTAAWIIIPALVALLIRLFLLGVYTIPSGSMEDTIAVGDNVATSQLSPRLLAVHRGDVIVFHDPANWLRNEHSTRGGDYLIKRLIGLPGDTVACKGAGYPITVNGVAVDESSYIKPGANPSDFAFDVTVSAGHVFVMGDNRANSADSRYHQNDGSQGLVPLDDVVGAGFMIYWPLTHFKLLPSKARVFAGVPGVDSATLSSTWRAGASAALQHFVAAAQPQHGVMGVRHE